MNFFETNAGVKVPKILYGTAWKKERTADLVCLAISSGFRGIDTACQPKHYNENGVGIGIEKSGIDRKNLYLQTKFTSVRGQDLSNIPYDVNSPIEEQVKESLNISLENLKTTYLDALILHSPMDTMEETLRVWNIFEGFVDSGQVKQLGISNCYDPDYFNSFYNETSIKPAILQNRFYVDSGFDVTLRKFCLKENIIYESFWTLSHNINFLRARFMMELANKYSVTPEVLLYRSLSERGVVPLCGTTSENHMKEDLLAFEFDLLDEDIDKLFKEMIK